MTRLACALFGALLLLAAPLAPARAETLAQDAFATRFAEMVRQSRPDLTVTIAGPLEVHVVGESVGERGKIAYLDNAYADYLGAPERLDAMLAQRVAAMLETGDAPPPEADRIVPIVKDRAWIDEAVAGVNADEASLVHETLTGELSILYAVDHPRFVAYLRADALETLGLERGELRALAVANLRRMLAPHELHRGANVHLLTVGGGYESSLLLFDEIWSGGELPIDGDPIVAVPARDVLLVTGSNNQAGLAEMRAIATKLATEASYRLSEQLFVRRDGGFQPFDE